MGRTEPSYGEKPAALRRDARAKRAKATVNKDIPTLLRAYPRAQRGVDTAELIAQPNQVVPDTKSEVANHEKKLSNVSEHPSIRVRCCETLQAAADLAHTAPVRKNVKPLRIAVLNMASPLRPGGGFINGATSQEESLCMRTTLYPSLREQFYRLPEVGGIYSPDVLVFRSTNADGEAEDLRKDDRFFIDVITAGMLRFPDTEELVGPDGSLKKTYVSEKDRLLIEQKMLAVMRICAAKKVRKLVLGAWGAGAYGNPTQEVANAWRKVLTGPESFSWRQTEIVFAIKEPIMATQFAEFSGFDLHEAESTEDQESENDSGQDTVRENRAKIVELEERIATARSDVLKSGLRKILDGLKAQDIAD